MSKKEENLEDVSEEPTLYIPPDVKEIEGDDEATVRTLFDPFYNGELFAGVSEFNEVFTQYAWPFANWTEEFVDASVEAGDIYGVLAYIEIGE